MKIVSILTLSLALIGCSTIAGNAFASTQVVNGKDGKTVTYSTVDSLNQASITYSSINNKVNWQGKVTLRNSCEYFKGSKLIPINYFTQSGPKDPTYALQVNVGTKANPKGCNKVARTATFWGYTTPVYFTPEQLSYYGNQFQVNYNYPSKIVNWYDQVKLGKLQWDTMESDTIHKIGFSYKIEGRVLKQGEKADCTGLRYGMIGPWCKYVVATSPKANVPPVKLTTVDQLNKHFGKIENLAQLQFIVGATRGNGFDAGQVIYNGKFLTREQRECTTEVNYVEFDPSTYKPTVLKSEETNLPALCE